jgi:hypothetical protein
MMILRAPEFFPSASETPDSRDPLLPDAGNESVLHLFRISRVPLQFLVQGLVFQIGSSHEQWSQKYDGNECYQGAKRQRN